MDVASVSKALGHKNPAITLRVYTRLAVTPEQIQAWSLPTQQPSRRDAVDHYAYPFDWTCQAEAVPPDLLAQLVADAMADLMDPARNAAVPRRESAHRDVIRLRLLAGS